MKRHYAQAYGIIGLILNGRAISPPNVFRGTWPLNEKAAIVILMISQGGLVVASIFGVIGSLRSSSLIFYSPAFILLGIFVSNLIFGSVCLKDSTRDISHDIFKAIQGNRRRGNDSEYFNWISDVQWEVRGAEQGINTYFS
jgi:hypothetical protein